MILLIKKTHIKYIIQDVPKKNRTNSVHIDIERVLLGMTYL